MQTVISTIPTHNLDRSILCTSTFRNHLVPLSHLVLQIILSGWLELQTSSTIQLSTNQPLSNLGTAKIVLRSKSQDTTDHILELCIVSPALKVRIAFDLFKKLHGLSVRSIITMPVLQRDIGLGTVLETKTNSKNIQQIVVERMSFSEIFRTLRGLRKGLIVLPISLYAGEFLSQFSKSFGSIGNQFHVTSKEKGAPVVPVPLPRTT